MDYQLLDGEVLFCGNCNTQFTTDKVNMDFSCRNCGGRVVSWTKNQSHEEAMRVWESINGKRQDFRNRQFQKQFTSSFYTINMANNHIERQIELLRDAKSLFNDHAEKVEELRGNFSSRVMQLEQDELNHDYMKFLEEFLGDYMAKLSTIRETIEDEYVPALERKIRHLEERE